MKNKWRILKILSTVVIFGFLLSFSLRRFNGAPMDKVSVNMIQQKTPVYFIDEKEVKNIVKSYNKTGKIGDINIPELEKKINSLPAVDSANVYLNLAGRLNLDIVQRVPAFRLNNNGRDFYVDADGTEFPVSKNYSHPSMLVTGDVKKDEYGDLVTLIDKINADEFAKKFFIGISKEKNSYHLLTSDGSYKVEIGDLENIDFKIKGFKEFAEKFLVYQAPEKYSKVSVKYNNQIVTTLNPHFAENDSILSVGAKELGKQPGIPKPVKTAPKAAEPKKAAPAQKPKAAPKPKPAEKKKVTPEKKKETVKRPANKDTKKK